MAIDLPSRARVVIVGGGVIGCSVAYHLSKMGWSDIVLVERFVAACTSVPIGDPSCPLLVVGGDNDRAEIASHRRALVDVLENRAGIEVGERFARETGRGVPGRDNAQDFPMHTRSYHSPGDFYSDGGDCGVSPLC